MFFNKKNNIHIEDLTHNLEMEHARQQAVDRQHPLKGWSRTGGSPLERPAC